MSEIAREIENLFGAQLSEALMRKGVIEKITIILPDTQYVVELHDSKRQTGKPANYRDRGKIAFTKFSPFGLNMKEIAKIIAVYFDSDFIIENSHHGINKSVELILEGTTIRATVKDRKGGCDA